jgi:hypothetical protein
MWHREQGQETVTETIVIEIHSLSRPPTPMPVEPWRRDKARKETPATDTASERSRTKVVKPDWHKRMATLESRQFDAAAHDRDFSCWTLLTYQPMQYNTFVC